MTTSRIPVNTSLHAGRMRLALQILLLAALRVHNLWPDCAGYEESPEIAPPPCQAGIEDALPYLMAAYWYNTTGYEEGVTETFDTPAGEAALYTDRYIGVYGGGINLGNGLFLVIFWQARDEDADVYLDLMRPVLESVVYTPPGVDDLGHAVRRVDLGGGQHLGDRVHLHLGADLVRLGLRRVARGGLEHLADGEVDHPGDRDADEEDHRHRQREDAAPQPEPESHGVSLGSRPPAWSSSRAPVSRCGARVAGAGTPPR